MWPGRRIFRANFICNSNGDWQTFYLQSHIAVPKSLRDAIIYMDARPQRVSVVNRNVKVVVYKYGRTPLAKCQLIRIWLGSARCDLTPHQHYIKVLGTHLVAKAHTFSSFSSDFHPKSFQWCLDRRALSPLTSGSTKQSTMSAHL